MNKVFIAIDIVLLFPPQINKEIVDFSDYLNSKYAGNIHLNHENRLPHVSLLMGVTKRDDLEKIHDVLKALQGKLPATLEMSGFKNTSVTSEISIKPTAELKTLQNELIAKAGPLLTYNPSPDMFHGDADPLTMKWVEHFISSSTGDNFNPHITLGPASQGETYKNPTTFEAPILALSQLGNYCTCAHVISQVSA